MSVIVEQIKSRLDIADVVSAYLKLEKAGHNFRARCPFHNEKTPSFFVSPSRQNYHCFGCGKGGDLINFVEQIEGLDFMGALEVLAHRAGVPFDRGALKTDNTLDRLRTILEDATYFFESNLTNDESAQKYLSERGITTESIKKFRVGYAPDGWRVLSEYLLARRFNEEELVLAGLVIKKEDTGRVYDRFRGRIMFPITDAVGRVIGFSGRVIVTSEAEIAKYINTPQTTLYDKSVALFGIAHAKQAIRERDRVVLVEGQMDLVMAHQVGTTEAVAVSGTALTDRHLLALKRLSNNVIIAFDADSAGVTASRRAVDLALSLGLEVRMAPLPSGQDPADCIKTDSRIWLETLDKNIHAIDFYLAEIRRSETNPRTIKQRVSAEVVPAISRLPDALEQSHFVSKVAAAIGVSEMPLWEEVKKRIVPMPRVISRAESVEAQKVEAPVSRLSMIAEKLLGIYWWTNDDDILQQAGEYLITLKTKLMPRQNELALKAEITYNEPKRAMGEIRTLLLEFKREVLREELEQATKELRQAEELGNAEAVDSALKKCQDISQSLHLITL
ncbi:MAG: DNA primase [Candidatus Vogelbacteria bacterium]|nr:DNA primase [Candidatus Vogelbacteria bacterium]